MKIYKFWKKSIASSENFVDKSGKIHGHIVKYRNEGWRAYVGNTPIMDRATTKPKNFKKVEDAKAAVEDALK